MSLLKVKIIQEPERAWVHDFPSTYGTGGYPFYSESIWFFAETSEDAGTVEVIGEDVCHVPMYCPAYVPVR